MPLIEIRTLLVPDDLFFVPRASLKRAHRTLPPHCLTQLPVRTSATIRVECGCSSDIADSAGACRLRGVARPRNPTLYRLPLLSADMESHVAGARPVCRRDRMVSALASVRGAPVSDVPRP